MREISNFRWQRPQAYLYALDLARDRAWFLNLDRDTLLRSAFLDQRIVADVSARHEVPLGELFAQPVRGAAVDPGFIFHTAFCCSTLLARSLDLPGRSLVLREPSPLLQLADLARGLAASPRSPEELLPATLNLLARPFAEAERIVMKPTNLAANLAPQIFAHRPAAKALVLYDELEAFLLSVLKRPRESAVGIERFLERLLADSPGRDWARDHLVPESLPARAALAWTLQVRGLRGWLAHAPPARVRILAAGELLASPAATLQAAAGWFGMPLTSAESHAVATGPLWQSHAKEPRLAYTPARRREEQVRARRLLASPLSAGLDYAENRLESRAAGFPDALRLAA